LCQSSVVSQSSVATNLRYGGIFNYCFIRRLLLSPKVKEFLKIGLHLAKLWARVGVLFLTHAGGYISVSKRLHLPWLRCDKFDVMF